MALADAVGGEVVTIDGKDLSGLCRLGCHDKGGIGKVHGMIRVLLHQLKGALDGKVVHEPDREAASQNEVADPGRTRTRRLSMWKVSVKTGTVVNSASRKVRRTAVHRSCCPSLGSNKATRGPVSTRITDSASCGSLPARLG